jgi:16S rRNA (adenine1518-N6/adenine1519-N6)-dimethyltransferase
MSIYGLILRVKLSEMREILASRGIELTKSLGQNFLHDQNQLQRIIAAANLSKADKVLEIGPGLGPLTELLLEKAGEVLAIEKDGRLVEVLRELFDAKFESHDPKFQLVYGDALKFLQQEPRDWKGWKLVANLPYSVASPILVEMACGACAPEKIVVTLQSEVAQRLMARADDDEYGILALLVQLDFVPRESFKIPGTCFFPEPDVASACVVLDRRPQLLLPEELRASYVKIVKRALSQRRKMMMKLLKADWPLERLTKAFAELKISPMERAEKLSLEQFVELTKLLN